ncbi:hypothetical protein CDAR_78351 [Caerostris darwini]|uniref:Uncharacterized protein n=1 Tax=Caerostris darwini TaxID=1538125 RepID=A0AAV4SDE5_9ARAC|nr:hypothetical protein CDAR_78351 [Caerostris darwini]
MDTESPKETPKARENPKYSNQTQASTLLYSNEPQSFPVVQQKLSEWSERCGHSDAELTERALLCRTGRPHLSTFSSLSGVPILEQFQFAFPFDNGSKEIALMRANRKSLFRNGRKEFGKSAEDKGLNAYQLRPHFVFVTAAEKKLDIFNSLTQLIAFKS